MNRTLFLLVLLLFLATCTTKNVQDWEYKRTEILDSMQAAMGILPDLKKLPPPAIQYTDSVRRSGYICYTVILTVAPDEVAPALLYMPYPAEMRKPCPAMLVLHSTGAPGKKIVDGQSPQENRACGKELAERGYIVIAPDYPGFGDLSNYDFEHDRYESGTMKGIFNHIRCIDLLCQMPEVNPDKIGVIGHSLGGHNAMFVAAFDTRIKVIVSSCGWTQHEFYDIGPKAAEQYGGRLGPYAQDRYMPLFRTKYQLDPEKIPFNYHEVITAFAPRPFFSNSPINDSNFSVEGVKVGVALASEAYKRFGKEENLQVVYPDTGHHFPREIREMAYKFIDLHLKQ
ncbi:MAG: alpha/beta fold hydrolase [Tannerella sp.]|jgi:pimeloyl-ACP methyl ester carboxylesterase|nr:alpha/beta fold hydrolase [Tannerella sp.]